MFLKDLNKFNSDYLDGKHASNSANNVPVLDSGAKVPLAQLPTGTTKDTLSLGNHTHAYAGSNSVGGAATSALKCTGNSATATTLETARTINNTSFDGSTNITTSIWGTSRTLTIGNKGKSVNGSGNVSWSLAEIGALPLAGGTMTGNITFSEVTSTTYPTGSNGLKWSGGTDGAEIFYRVIDNDQGQLVLNLKDDENVTLGFAYNGTVKSTIDANGSFSGNAATATTLATARTINGTSFNGSGNITTANWGTARTLTIGNKGKSVNGSGNVSWSLSEMGAVNKAGDTMTGQLSLAQGSRVHQSAAGSGSTGYILIAQIKISGNYQNQPIRIGIARRGDSQITDINIRFSNANNADPALEAYNKVGPASAYLYKSATSTWDLYIQKSESYDNIEVMYFNKGTYMEGTTITWKSEHVSSLPSGYGTLGLRTLESNVSGNAGSATKLQTARNITIGNATKSFNGTGNISFTASEMGLSPNPHWHVNATTKLWTGNVGIGSTMTTENLSGFNYILVGARPGNSSCEAWACVPRNHFNSSSDIYFQICTETGYAKFAMKITNNTLTLTLSSGTSGSTLRAVYGGF